MPFTSILRKRGLGIFSNDSQMAQTGTKIMMLLITTKLHKMFVLSISIIIFASMDSSGNFYSFLWVFIIFFLRFPNLNVVIFVLLACLKRCFRRLEFRYPLPTTPCYSLCIMHHRADVIYYLFISVVLLLVSSFFFLLYFSYLRPFVAIVAFTVWSMDSS